MSIVPFVHVDTSLADRDAGELLELDARDLHHLTTVLRLRPEAEVELADGRGGWALARLTPAGATLRTAPVWQPAPRPVLRVAQGLPKGRKLDGIVRVCTELGVDELVPVAAARSVTRLTGPKADRAVERWGAVARAASEQARRVRRPLVSAIRSPADLEVDPADLIVAHPGGTPLPQVVDDLASGAQVTVAVGPEGGWSPTELAGWTDHGVRLVGLGPTVLRTEHAAAAALAVLAAALGRWGGDAARNPRHADRP